MFLSETRYITISCFNNQNKEVIHFEKIITFYSNADSNADKN